MKRIITLIPLLFLLLTGCQQDIAPDYAEIPDAEVMTRSASSERLGPDDPVVFLPARDMKAWTDIGPLEDRFAACEVPSSRLNQMTTEALVKSIMNYPLNFLIFVYDDPLAVIDMIVANSPLHKELISRNDFAEILVDIYAATELDKKLTKSDYDGNYKSLSYTNALFMDYFLASKFIRILESSSVSQKLAKTVAEKIMSRLQDTKTYSMFSIRPLLDIDDIHNLGVASSSRISPIIVISYETIYTGLGYPIEACINEEMTACEMEYVINDCVANYPEATIIGSATRDYNCHSYAWYEQSTDNQYWINSYDSQGYFQLSKFWTHDKYIACSEGDADIIYYYDTYSGLDHSAIKSETEEGKYISKWGQGPLMKHAPMHCPYKSYNRSYYKKYLSDFSIQGQTSAIMNNDYVYTVTFGPECPVLELEWEVRFMDAQSPTPFVLQVDASTGNRTATLNCQDYGLYKIIVRGYRNGVYNDYAQLNVIATPY